MHGNFSPNVNELWRGYPTKREAYSQTKKVVGVH
jgi:hypothetical protein